MNKIFVIIALSSFIFINYVNVDSCVAQFNINKGGKFFDREYILRLSDDAIDEKLAILEMIKQEENYKEDYDFKRPYRSKENSFYNFNYFNFRGQEFVRELDKELK
jgi:hypothetical protein